MAGGLDSVLLATCTRTIWNAHTNRRRLQTPLPPGVTSEGFCYGGRVREVVMSTWSVQCKSFCCRLVVRLAGITDTIIVRVDVQYVTCVGRGLAADVASMSA